MTTNTRLIEATKQNKNHLRSGHTLLEKETGRKYIEIMEVRNDGIIGYIDTNGETGFIPWENLTGFFIEAKVITRKKIN